MDYGPFHTLVAVLVGNFGADIEAHHPGIDTLHMPPEVVDAWKVRLRVVTRPDGTTRERRNLNLRSSWSRACRRSESWILVWCPG
jgi:hypothetical protein